MLKPKDKEVIEWFKQQSSEASYVPDAFLHVCYDVSVSGLLQIEEDIKIIYHNLAVLIDLYRDSDTTKEQKQFVRSIGRIQRAKLNALVETRKDIRGIVSDTDYLPDDNAF